MTETPVTETPVTETPVTETPVTETPVTETPATETRGSDTPSTSAPATPNLLGAAVTPEGHVMLVWVNPADASITGYQVLRGPDADSLVVIEEDTGSSGTGYTDTTPPAGQTHTYAVKARNAVGLSPLSNTITATVPVAEEELITARHTAAGNTLVSNLGQTPLLSGAIAGTSTGSRHESAMSFTTGANPLGYHVTSVVLSLKQFVSVPSPLVSIRDNNEGIPSETVLYTFTTSSAITDNVAFHLITFTTTNATTLQPNTTYWLYVTTSGANSMASRLTASNAEDTESQVGWQIGNTRYNRRNAGAWVAPAGNNNLQFEMRGHEGPPLVSNFGQTDNGQADTYSGNESAQSFIAGPGLAGFGYRFQGIRVAASATAFGNDIRVPVVRASLHGDANGRPGARLHTLTLPGDFASTVGFEEYTLSAPPATVLRGGARYWVVFGVSYRTLFLRTTSSSVEDQGLDGWSIDNERYSKDDEGWVRLSRVIKLAVLGSPEWVTDEPDGVDFPGADFNAHETFGVVTPGTVSNGHLTPGLDRNNGQTGDYWYLDTRPGGSYRVEVKFGNSSGNDTGGSAGIEFLDPDGVDYASGCCESDHNRDDGHTFVHFTHSRQSREWNTSYLVHVAAYDQLNSDSRIYNGPYTITMADITGTDMVASNLYLGETNNLLTTVSASRIYGVPFTTGTAGGGYELDRIYAHIINNYGNPRLSLYRGTARGSKLCDFRNPSQVQHHVDWSSGPPAVPFLAPDCAGTEASPEHHIPDSLRRKQLRRADHRCGQRDYRWVRLDHWQ